MLTNSDDSDDDLDSMPADLPSLIQTSVAQTSWEGIISYVAKTGNYLAYQLTIRYAIGQSAHPFIQAALKYSEVMGHLNYHELTDWLITQPPLFRTEFIVVAIASGAREHPFIDIIRTGIKRYFKALMTNDDEDIPKPSSATVAALHDPRLEYTRFHFLRDWIHAFSACYGAAVHKERMASAFFNHLSINEDNAVKILSDISSSQDLSESDKSKVSEEFLKRYSLTPEQIISIVNIIGASSANLCRQLLVQLTKEVPGNPHYQLMLEFLNTPLEKRFDFILKNPPLLNIDNSDIPEGYQMYAMGSLSLEQRKELFAKCITHEFPFFISIMQYLFSYDKPGDETLLTDYLKAKHLPLMTKMLDYIVEFRNSFHDLAGIIGLVLRRTDYQFQADDVFYPLLLLFKGNHEDSIEVVLSHPAILNLLKSYYKLSGDNYFSVEERDTLMPRVVAWYMAKNINQCRELFFSLTPEQQDKVRSLSFIPQFIEDSQPRLSAYAFQRGYWDFLAKDTFNSRFIRFGFSSVPEVTAPQHWKKPGVLAVLKQYQRHLTHQFSEKQAERLPFAVISEEARKLAPKMAMNYQTLPLLLQHQTSPESARAIFKDGTLKLPLHVLGHALFGKATRGIERIGKPQLSPKDMGFSFFVRLPDLEDKQTRITTFRPGIPPTRLVFNLGELLKLNPQIKSVVIGPYNDFDQTKTLKLNDDYTIESHPDRYLESTNMRKITLDSPGNASLCIYTALFERVIDQFLTAPPDALKQAVIDRLINPKTVQDYKLAIDLINLLHLEWLVPGDIPLHLAYVDLIEYEGNTYPLAELREVINNQTEADSLAAIKAINHLQPFPFVLEELLFIAKARGFKQVTAAIQPPKKSDSIVYYPPELYQIEAVAELILEEFSGQVYLHLEGNTVILHCTLIDNSNKNGVHHAEMSKLHTALKLANFNDKSALDIRLGETVRLPFGGENDQFASLEAIRDALICYELTTLLVSQQNWEFYLENNGSFHPKTGKGATNGKNGLLTHRLFFDNQPATIDAAYIDKTTLVISCSLPHALPIIAKRIRDTLNIPQTQIQMGANQLMLIMQPTTLIAKLRQAAVCYEGLNVIDEKGRLLMAHRHNKGLASAGGHHGDKYSRLSIAYGLKSEFNLVFKTPEKVANDVLLLAVEKPKTGLYIIHGSALLTDTFRADPEEFIAGSEVALSLIEMRGKLIYDVMPLEKLCSYYLHQLEEFISNEFPESKGRLEFKINTEYTTQLGAHRYKVPEKKFGQITLSLPDSTQLSQALENTLQGFEVVAGHGKRRFVINENPFTLMQLIASELNHDSSEQLRMRG
ncbi:hypothetical protein [Legionella erythra]|uniref:Uncharacterized protein n=1 Tax=Legionella erythra TaxID=448 RepID=A0A0W0TQH7_LEGER|nr:hypothetical protein [Legionella erythra]KTC97837.1 hypothetical protein Lery_1676 [Legionella erythra]